MTLKPLFAGLIIIPMLAGIAHSEIRITVSRFDNDQLDIRGQTSPHRQVIIDNKFKLESDDAGYFEFKQSGYKPADCMSDIRSGSDIYSAVIAGCFGEFSIEREAPKTPAPPR